MAKKCPSCGKPASGKFCSECGASLSENLKCVHCGNEIPRGGRFCNMCGRAIVAGMVPVGSAGAPVPAYVWAGGGVALVITLVAVLFWPRSPSGATIAETGAPASAAGDPTAVDLSSMTPREAAERLFNRVMTSVSAGDSAEARSFAPMAIMAYESVPDLTADERYHMAVLHMVNRNLPAARAQADTILAQYPNHLFALYTAAQTEAAQGRSKEAAELYGRVLDSWDSELAAGRPEYSVHEGLLPLMREESARAVAANPQ
jgi:hypothetical protein